MGDWGLGIALGTQIQRLCLDGMVKGEAEPLDLRP